jgi:MFS family permease
MIMSVPGKDIIDDRIMRADAGSVGLGDPFAQPYSKVKAWLVVLACFLFYLSACASLNMMTPILNAVLTEFDQGTRYGATLSSLFVMANAVCAIPVGLLITKFGFRKVGYIGFAMLLGGAIYGATFVNSSTDMIVCRIIQGIGYTVPSIIDTAVIVQWFPARKLGVPLGIMGGASGLSSSIMHLVSNILTPYGTWRPVWWSLAVIVVVSFFFFLFFLKPGPGQALIDEEQKKPKSQRMKLRSILMVPQIWACSILFFTYSVILKGFMPFTNLIFIENCGCSNELASALSSVFSFGLMLSGLIGGVLYGKTGKYKGVVFLVISAIWFAGMCWGFTLHSVVAAWIFVTIFGALRVGRTFTHCVLPLFCPSPGALAIAMSFFVFVGQYLGGILGPYIMEFAQDVGGTWTACGWVVAVCGIVGTIVTAYLAVSFKKRESSQI